ncbi:MAG: methyltransferase domain-containing protein [Bacteroidetes bacterium]|nr:methyltransferase domain-containing protein [Bacteroidota bacterium]
MRNETSNTLIQQNVALHTRIAGSYDKRHAEIYNAPEQRRLLEALKQAISIAQVNAGTPRVLDYGCGAGNLTRHFLDLGCSVVAADVTPSFLDVVHASFDSPRLSTQLLNGADLREFTDASFDIVATYSVLHHVPDYLAIVSEFARVVKPGGVIVIDHEANETFWTQNPKLLEFQRATKKRRSILDRLSDLTRPAWYAKKWKKLKDPRFQEEGDIHVWPDDHIEWPKIREVLRKSGVDSIHEEDYLLYQAHYDETVYRAFASECSDMHLYIGRKQ